MFFSPVTLRRLRSEYIRRPDFQGELSSKKDREEVIIPSSCRFKPGLTSGRMKWWGELYNGRPDQSHSYIIGTDISLGTGASNSVHLVYDVNTNEEVGIWVCPNTPPESLADIAIVLAYWVGGSSKPLLIWENNGPGGAYGKRIKFYAYPKIYIQRDERQRRQKQKNAYGWHSSPDGKIDLCQDLDIAMGQAIRGSKAHTSFLTHDEDLLKELESYINYESGGIGPAKLAKDSSGAQKAHGDRVIPAGLVLLGKRFQPKGRIETVEVVEKDSILYRRLEAERQEQSEAETRRW
jgi:hypothetical protein